MPRVIPHFTHPPGELTCRHTRNDDAVLAAAPTALCWWLKGKAGSSGGGFDGCRDRVGVEVLTPGGPLPVDCQPLDPAGRRSPHHLLLRKRLDWQTRDA